MGDSITEGYGLASQSRSGYPEILDSLLGPGYSVLNCGRSATTMSKRGDFPYWIAKEFSNVFASEPDMIIIKLGTNDTKPQNWDSEVFESSYQALIDTFNTIQSRPEIILCYPVPVFKTRWGIHDSTLVYGVIPAIEKIAENNKLRTVNLNLAFKGQGQYFPDHIHPNEAGAIQMATAISGVVRKN